MDQCPLQVVVDTFKQQKVKEKSLKIDLRFRHAAPSRNSSFMYCSIYQTCNCISSETPQTRYSIQSLLLGKPTEISKLKNIVNTICEIHELHRGSHNFPLFPVLQGRETVT